MDNNEEFQDAVQELRAHFQPQVNLKPPPPLNFDGNISENWKKWIKRFNIYIKATGNSQKPDEMKIAILLHVLGEEAQERFETFDLTEEQKESYEEVIIAFENFCVPKRNESVCRYQFFKRVQQEGEPFDDFVTDLRKLSMDCAFEQLKDSLIKDKIVSGICATHVKDRLLREENLTLQRCIQLCKAAEVAADNMRTLKDNKEKEVDVIHRGKPVKNMAYGQSMGQRKERQESGDNKTMPSFSNARGSEGEQQRHACSKCGLTHAYRNCAAYGKKCNICLRFGHFAKMCINRRSINAINTIEDDREEKIYRIGMIESKNENKKYWSETIKVVNTNETINLKLDTGAECNVLGLKECKRINKDRNLRRTQSKLYNYDGSCIRVLGKIAIDCIIRNKIEKIEFFVVDTEESKAIIGLPTIEKLRLLVRIDVIKKTDYYNEKILENYEEIFKGMGKIAKIYDFKLKEKSEGRVEPNRKVPFKIMDAYKKELDYMQENEIIVKVEEPTEFVNNVVIIKKPNGTLRICLDPQYLNSCLLREHFKLPTFEKISSRIQGAKVFSVLDANKAFWQIGLSKASSLKTTFQTPFGRFRFLRMPYGIKTAPEIFQRTYSELFRDIPNVEIYIDDIMIWAENEIEHRNILQKVLERAKQHGVKFNKEKCIIGAREIKFLGHKFSEKGLEIDENKIEAIIKMEEPKDKKAVEQFLGVITYVSRFIKGLTDVTTPLRMLVKKDAEFVWQAEHKKVFEKIKSILSKSPVLQYYNPKKGCTVSVDASSTGVGAVLLQDKLPVAYASKALTESQKKWAQIEKETYAIVFGCERFRQYIIGQETVIETDHKPLLCILNKSVNEMPARLQKMKMKLQLYDIRLQYVPGKELLIADALSRSHLKESEEDIDPKLHILEVIIESAMSKNRKQEFIIETEKDKEMQVLLKLIREGWPAEIKDVPNEAKAYHTYHGELYEYEGMIFKKECVVVPNILRRKILDCLHYNHMGTEKTKNRAREIVYWPGMNKDIEEKIKNCKACLKFQNNNQKETLMQSEVPTQAWVNVAVDLFYIQNNAYILITDYFSKYVDVIELKDESSLSTIKALKNSFGRWGIPELIRSDNGPQFSAREFKIFSNEWNFKHVTSSPRYPRSNGMVERQVQTVKRTIKKAIYDNKDVTLALIEINNTPISNTIPSPNHIMMGRNIVGVLPNFITEKHIVNRNLNIRRELIKRRDNQKFFHDRHAKDMVPFEIGQNVRYENSQKTWDRAVVVERDPNERAYKIKTEKGRTLIRNRAHLNKDSRDPMISEDQMIGGDEDVSYNQPNMEEGEVRADQTLANTTQSLNNTLGNNETILLPQIVADNVTTTRSGRVIQKPKYLNAYDTS